MSFSALAAAAATSAAPRAGTSPFYKSFTDADVKTYADCVSACSVRMTTGRLCSVPMRNRGVDQAARTVDARCRHKRIISHVVRGGRVSGGGGGGTCAASCACIVGTRARRAAAKAKTAGGAASSRSCTEQQQQQRQQQRKPRADSTAAAKAAADERRRNQGGGEAACGRDARACRL